VLLVTTPNILVLKPGKTGSLEAVVQCTYYAIA